MPQPGAAGILLSAACPPASRPGRLDRPLHRLAQLQDNLGAAQLGLPPEIVARLDAAAGIDLGFPATFIQDNTPWVFGAAALPAGG